MLCQTIWCLRKRRWDHAQSLLSKCRRMLTSPKDTIVRWKEHLEETPEPTGYVLSSGDRNLCCFGVHPCGWGCSGAKKPSRLRSRWDSARHAEGSGQGCCCVDDMPQCFMKTRDSVSGKFSLFFKRGPEKVFQLLEKYTSRHLRVKSMPGFWILHSRAEPSLDAFYKS